MKKLSVTGLIIGLIIIGVILAVSIFDWSNSIASFPATEYKMFSDISMLGVLDEYEVKAIEKDSALRKLVPVNSFTKTVSFENKKFDVYAYEFETMDERIAYVRSATGEKRTDKAGSYMYNKGTKVRLCLFYENNAILIQDKGFSAVSEFYALISTDFDIRIKDVI